MKAKTFVVLVMVFLLATLSLPDIYLVNFVNEKNIAYAQEVYSLCSFAGSYQCYSGGCSVDEDLIGQYSTPEACQEALNQISAPTQPSNPTTSDDKYYLCIHLPSSVLCEKQCSSGSNPLQEFNSYEECNNKRNDIENQKTKYYLCKTPDGNKCITGNDCFSVGITIVDGPYETQQECETIWRIVPGETTSTNPSTPSTLGDRLTVSASPFNPQPNEYVTITARFTGSEQKSPREIHVYFDNQRVQVCGSLNVCTASVRLPSAAGQHTYYATALLQDGNTIDSNRETLGGSINPNTYGAGTQSCNDACASQSQFGSNIGTFGSSGIGLYGYGQCSAMDEWGFRQLYTSACGQYGNNQFGGYGGFPQPGGGVNIQGCGQVTRLGVRGQYQCAQNEQCYCVFMQMSFGSSVSNPQIIDSGSASIPGTGQVSPDLDPDALPEDKIPRRPANDLACEYTSDVQITGRFVNVEGQPALGSVPLVPAGTPLTIEGTVEKATNACKGYSYHCRKQYHPPWPGGTKNGCHVKRSFFQTCIKARKCSPGDTTLYKDGETCMTNWGNVMMLAVVVIIAIGPMLQGLGALMSAIGGWTGSAAMAGAGAVVSSWGAAVTGFLFGGLGAGGTIGSGGGTVGSGGAVAGQGGVTVAVGEGTTATTVTLSAGTPLTAGTHVISGTLASGTLSSGTLITAASISPAQLIATSLGLSSAIAQSKGPLDLGGCVHVCTRDMGWTDVAASNICNGYPIAAKADYYNCGGDAGGSCGGFENQNVELKVVDRNQNVFLTATTKTDSTGKFSFTFDSPGKENLYVAVATTDLEATTPFPPQVIGTGTGTHLICGDQICDFGEDKNTCSADCS